MKFIQQSWSKGGGDTLGPRNLVPSLVDVKWITSTQVRSRYGNRSAMWVYRKVKFDPAFPKPTYFGRMQMFLVEQLDKYDETLIQQKSA
jgi:hypothetical protein